MPELRSGRPEPTDWDLLAATADGDEDAFRELVERHQDRLIPLCERLLSNREEALDAAQEVLIKMYDKAGTLQPKGQLYTWLYRVATNYCLNLLRRQRIVKFLPFAAERDDAAVMEPPDQAPDPMRAFESRQEWTATRRAISQLPENQRVVLILAKFEGMSYREIAQTLEITEGAVESRLFRAVRNLTRAQESSSPRVPDNEERS